MNVAWKDSVTTTMAWAREAPAHDRDVFAAKAMTAGKGQGDNAWHAPEGGLYLTLVLVNPPQPHLLSLATGLAVADLLEMTGIDAQVKWPNDVLVEGRKIAGVLIENDVQGDQTRSYVGIGINLNGKASAFPSPLDSTATTLEDLLGVESCVEDTLGGLEQALEHRLRQLEDGQENELLADLRAKDFLLGKQVRIGTVEGEAQGLASDGALLVGGQSVHAGRVELA